VLAAACGYGWVFVRVWVVCRGLLFRKALRVAPLRMWVGRAVPGNQVLSDFSVLTFPGRADCTDQESYMYLFLRKG